jgi:hypothetical protein
MDAAIGSGENRPGWVGAVLARPYTIAALAMYAGMFIPFMTLNRDWESCLLVEAMRMWRGGTIYGHPDLYPYPPLPAFLAVPFAFLPFDFGQVLFYTLNMGCLVLMVRWAWLLTGGGVLQGVKTGSLDNGGWREHLILSVGMLCGFSFAWNCLSHHQLDLFIGAAMIGGCQALARSRTYLAAMCFGLAAAFKGPALLWGLYLAWRGRWKEALCVAGLFVGLNIMPSLVVPAQFERLKTDGYLLFVEWGERFLKPMGESSDNPHFWYSESNQSLIGGGYRWFCTDWNWTDRFRQRLPIAEPASPGQLRVFALVCAGVLISVTMLVQGRKKLADPVGHSPSRLSLECGMVFMLMLLLSPMTSKAHCGTLLVPAFALARLVEYHRSQVLSLVLAAALLAVVCSQNFMGDFLTCIAMWHGTVTWAALLMWVGCGCALRKHFPKTPHSPAPAETE